MPTTFSKPDIQLHAAAAGPKKVPSGIVLQSFYSAGARGSMMRSATLSSMRCGPASARRP